VAQNSPEIFLKACGASSPLELLVEQSGQTQGLNLLHRPFALVGRQRGNDIILKDKRVSRRHAYFQILAGEVFCVDLGSHTGTHWPDGSRSAGWLDKQRSIELGGCKLRFVGESSAEKPIRAIDPMAAGCLQKPLLTLQFLGEGLKQPCWSMNRMLALIGSAPCCKVRFHEDADIAPVHGSLVCTPEGTWVIDLLSPAGVHVNGQKVRLARLEDGDELQVGTFAMRVHCLSASEFALRTAHKIDPHRHGQNGTTQHSEKSGASFALSTRQPPAPFPQALEIVVDKRAMALVESVVSPLMEQFCAAQNQMLDQFQQAIVMMFQMLGAFQKEQMDFIRADLDRVEELTREIQALQAELKNQRSAHPPAPAPDGVARRPISSSNLPATPPTVSTNGRERGPESPKPAVTAAGESGEDVHAWLCQRMAELQADRRGRLQRILDFMSGK
jgi:pSer/pThr/pTyr-binding forkhead associated (FHA) protein/polyhydroxyalkanoate synthesis regulator phasin